MTYRDHYRHARMLGAFRAVDCLRMARDAALLDHAAAVRAIPPPALACWETLHDGSNPLRLSRSVTVY